MMTQTLINNFIKTVHSDICILLVELECNTSLYVVLQRTLETIRNLAGDNFRWQRDYFPTLTLWFTMAIDHFQQIF